MQQINNINQTVKDKEFSLYTLFFYISCILGVSVFIKYFYASYQTPDDIGYWFGQYSFMSIQALLDTVTIVLLYVAIKNKLSLKFIIGTFFLFFYLNDLRYIVKIHHFISNLDLYWGVFKTGDDGTVTTLQYARITLISIAFVMAMISTFFLKRSLLQIFVFIVSVAILISVILLHYYVAFKPSKEASVSIGEQMTMVEYSSNPVALCEYSGYICNTIKRGDKYNYGKLRKQNLATSVNSKDIQISINELNKIINDGVQYIFENEEEKKYFHEGSFNANLFRAVVFNIRKLDNDTVLVILDNKEMSRSTETYLGLLNFYCYLFILFWGLSFRYLYRVHKNMNKKGQLDKLLKN